MIFKALIFVCHIANPTQCFYLEDVREKLTSKRQCIDRVFEMRTDLIDFMPHYKAIKWKCIELREGKFT
tara:strand:- start:1223 stop:1429 length:207 start_codon:yes stop_codon:yes gene_type:complete